MTDYIQNINLGWDSSDSSPILAGNLDVNNNSIVSINNGDINIIPDGTGRIILDGVRVDGNTVSSINGQPVVFSNDLTLQGNVLVSGTIESTAAGTPTIESVADINIEPGGELVIDAPTVLKSYTVTELASKSASAGAIVYCSNESGGAVPAFYDGTNWRRFTDRNIVS